VFQSGTRILFGGDFGYEPNGKKLASLVSQTNPDVILIGGDIAYDNGNIHCYYSYDTFLWAFEHEFQELNRIVPFIFSIGNHDIGFNSLANYNITVSPQHGPLYFTYFPQRFENELLQTGIPSIENRHT
jgi:predicted MPP superfamily phosphohydrolase